jgi:hypothetical protein
MEGAEKQRQINDPMLVQILVEMNRWEDDHRPELQTISGRQLYFGIASNLLTSSEIKTQSMKLLDGRVTDRAIRTRMREFQKMELVEVSGNLLDARNRQALPTEKLIAKINQHTKLLKQLCEIRYLMIAKI